jgi:hypothetical protein
MDAYSIVLMGLIYVLDLLDPKIIVIPMYGIFWPDSGIDTPRIWYSGIDSPKIQILPDIKILYPFGHKELLDIKCLITLR